MPESIDESGGEKLKEIVTDEELRELFKMAGIRQLFVKEVFRDLDNNTFMLLKEKDKEWLKRQLQRIITVIDNDKGKIKTPTRLLQTSLISDWRNMQKGTRY